MKILTSLKHIISPANFRNFTLFTLLATLTLSACAVPVEESSTLEITDTTGYTQQLPAQPERIVLAGKAISMLQDTVYLFEEARDQVVGLENRKQSAFDFLPVIDDSILEIATLESNAGPEQIAVHKPDLVIMKSFMADKFREPLQKLGIPSVYLNLETPTAFYEDIEVLGKIFENPERAQEIIDFYQTRVERVEKSMANLEDTQKPNVLLLEYSNQGGEIAFYVPPVSWIQTTLTEIAGGKPVWVDVEQGGGWVVVTFEQIAAWNPDQIYIIDYAGGAVQVVESLKSNTLWAELAAVQTEQLYAFPIDFYSWDQPDTRWILGLQWLATKIHPDLTQNIDIIAEVEDFYSTLYYLDADTIEAEVKNHLMGDIP